MRWTTKAVLFPLIVVAEIVIILLLHDLAVWTMGMARADGIAFLGWILLYPVKVALVGLALAGNIILFWPPEERRRRWKKPKGWFRS